MATQYTTCPGCATQNVGINARCTNCGTILPFSPISPMPMQPVGGYRGQMEYYPGKLQAISIIQTVAGSLELLGGIFGLIYVLFVALVTFGIGLVFIPVPIIFLVIGGLSLMSGIKGLNKKTNFKLSFGVAISQMVLLLLCDVLSFGSGLAGVILLTQDEIKHYRALHTYE